MRSYYAGVWPRYAAFAKQRPELFAKLGYQLPEKPDDAAFAKLHTFQGVFVQPVVLGEHAYVGFSFHAAWEREHGVGVLTHDLRVVRVGNAETSFTQWMAEGDAREHGAAK